MDPVILLESWGTLGATGVISLLFGFMITNLIKSQKHQDGELEAIREILSKKDIKDIEWIKKEIPPFV